MCWVASNYVYVCAMDAVQVFWYVRVMYADESYCYICCVSASVPLCKRGALMSSQTEGDIVCIIAMVIVRNMQLYVFTVRKDCGVAFVLVCYYG